MHTPNKILGGFSIATKTTRNFFYKASRDIISTSIGTFITILLFIVMKLVFNRLRKSEDQDIYYFTMVVEITYLCLAILILLCIGIGIYTNTYRELIIKSDEIVYQEGWISQKTTTVPANKIRSCSTFSGPLQRLCGTMDIQITTTGDSAEIYFSNIFKGELAYQRISELAKKN